LTQAVIERPAILTRYFDERQDLLARRVPLDGWTVRISPSDAARLRRWYEQVTESFREAGALDLLPGSGSHLFGADWVEDDSVPEGELRIDVPGGVR